MTDRHSRREFIGLVALGAASALTSRRGLGIAASLAAPTPDADLVVFNARIYTMHPALPRAEAFAVKGGRFIAIGKTSDIKGLVRRGTQTFDAKRMTIVPGFIDTHNHAGGTTLLYEVLVGNPFEVEFVSIASIVDKLRAKARATPAGTWVDGYFFDDTKLTDKRPLNVHDLDQVSTEHPVVVHHRGGHTSFYNSKALELARVTKDTANPPGGTFDRDGNGELTGRVTDRARNVFNGVGQRPSFTAAERAQKAFPRADMRPKITHCTLINDDLVRRIKAAGAVPAMFTTYAYYNSDKFVFYGGELMKRCMAYRTLLDAGVPAAAGSDFSPGPFAPLMGIQGMVTRTGWDGQTWGANQRITVDEAIKVNTINGAYASHEESLKGSISDGKLADFVVLADDPHAVSPEKIKDIQIVRTAVGGTTVYEA